MQATSPAQRTYIRFCNGKVLREAHEVDMKYDNGTDIKPLCGLLVSVKDLYDVAGYHTVAGTPALAGDRMHA